MKYLLYLPILSTFLLLKLPLNLDCFVALLGKQCIGRVSIQYLFSCGKCHKIQYQFSIEILTILFLCIWHFKIMDKWREVVQDGDEVKSWTPLLPQTHQIYGYILSNSFWKRPKNYLYSSFTLNEKGATSRQVGEDETIPPPTIRGEQRNWSFSLRSKGFEPHIWCPNF